MSAPNVRWRVVPKPTFPYAGAAALENLWLQLDRPEEPNINIINHPMIATQTQTCWICPEQYEGTLTDGRFFYYRMRRGTARLGVGSTIDEAVENCWDYSEGHGDPLQGFFDPPEARDEIFESLLNTIGYTTT